MYMVLVCVCLFVRVCMCVYMSVWGRERGGEGREGGKEGGKEEGRGEGGREGGTDREICCRNVCTYDCILSWMIISVHR